MAYSLTWLPDVLRKAGLKVVEIDGWKTRGHGDMGKVFGAMCHHTAECKDDDLEPALKTITHGRKGMKGAKDLLGPLANLGLGQDGTWYMIAAGKAWHAGPGEWQGVTDGNYHFLGIEAENDGIGEVWPEVQADSFARGCAIIAKYCGFGSQMVVGHKEWAPKRKIDPNFDMAVFRKRVKGYL